MRHRSNIMMISRTGRIIRRRGRRKWHGKKNLRKYTPIFSCVRFFCARFWCRCRSHLVSSLIGYDIPCTVPRCHDSFLKRFFLSRRDAPTEPIYDKNAEKVNNTIYFHYFLSDATILHIFSAPRTLHIKCRQSPNHPLPFNTHWAEARQRNRSLPFFSQNKWRGPWTR